VKWGNTKITFFTQILYYSISALLNSTMVTAWFLQSFCLTTHSHAAMWLPS